MATLQVAINARRAAEGAKQFDRAAGQVTTSARAAAGSVRALNSATTAVGPSARGAIVALGRFKTIIAGLGVYTAARTIASFEEAMAKVRGVTEASNEQFTLLNEKARTIGATTRFSATDAANGLLFLARAGYGVQGSLEAVDATMTLAAASGMELGRAADFASNIVSQFGLKATQTERVVDVLVKTANSANTNVEQLAEALSYSGTVAAKAGIPIETVAAAIGVLGDSGIQATRAGTDMRSMVLSLVAPTTDAKKIIEDLGLTLQDVNPTANDLIDVFERLKEANLGLGEAAKIFGERSAAGSLAIINAIDKVERLSEANRRAEGAARKLAQIQNDTLAGSWRNLKSAAEGAVHSIGEAGFKGILRGIIDVAADAARGVGSVADELARVRKEGVIVSNIARRGGGTVDMAEYDKVMLESIRWLYGGVTPGVKKIAPIKFYESPFYGRVPRARMHIPTQALTYYGMQNLWGATQMLPLQAALPFGAGLQGVAPGIFREAERYSYWTDYLGREHAPVEYPRRRVTGLGGIPGVGPGGLVGAAGFAAAMPEIMRQAELHLAVMRELQATWQDWQRGLLDTAAWGAGNMLFEGLTRGAEGFRDALRSVLSEMARFALQMATRMAMLAAIKSIPGGADWLHDIGFLSAQSGFSGIVNKPTVFLAHQGEHVQVTPSNSVNAQFHYHGISQHDAMRRTNRQLLGEVLRNIKA